MQFIHAPPRCLDRQEWAQYTSRTPESFVDMPEHSLMEIPDVYSVVDPGIESPFHGTLVASNTSLFLYDYNLNAGWSLPLTCIDMHALSSTPCKVSSHIQRSRCIYCQVSPSTSASVSTPGEILSDSVYARGTASSHEFTELFLYPGSPQDTQALFDGLSNAVSQATFNERDGSDADEPQFDWSSAVWSDGEGGLAGPGLDDTKNDDTNNDDTKSDDTKNEDTKNLDPSDVSRKKPRVL